VDLRVIIKIQTLLKHVNAQITSIYALQSYSSGGGLTLVLLLLSHSKYLTLIWATLSVTTYFCIQ
jgi:hypothetical protein